MALEETVLQQLDLQVRSYIEKVQTRQDSLSSRPRDLEARYEVLDEEVPAPAFQTLCPFE